MKVVQINTFSYKAAGNIMMNLHRALLNKGVDSYVVWGRGRKAQNEHEYYMDDDLGVKIHGAYTRLTDKTGFASVSATRKLLKWIDDINPDIIHLHCIHGYYINIELLFNYIKKNNIRVVWTQHDCWAFTGHCAYFDACGCEKWKTGCYACEQIHTYPISRFKDNSKWNWNRKRELFSNLDMTIVVPSKWLANTVKQSFIGMYPIKTIYNGIDTSIFKLLKSDFKYKYGIGNRRIILGVAGEWTERKGLKDFIKLNDLIDKSKYIIVIVGVTKKQVKNLSKDMILINRTNKLEELIEIYSAADVYFNPTYEDNFPTTNLEAIACNTYVITYNTGGCSEEVDENTGCIVEKGNLDEVLNILYRNDIYNKFDNKKHFKFSTQNMIDSYIKLYNEIYMQDRSS